MSIPVPNFNMLWKKLILFKFVSLGISQYFYKVAKENFLVYASGINPTSSMAFTNFLYCWGCHWVLVIKNSYPITLEIIKQLIWNIAGCSLSCLETTDDITCVTWPYIFADTRKKLKVAENVIGCKLTSKDNYLGVKQWRALQ